MIAIHFAAATKLQLCFLWQSIIANLGKIPLRALKRHVFLAKIIAMNINCF